MSQPKSNEEIEQTPAYKALMDKWGQLDEDGIAIAVSRQALVETVEMYKQALAQKDAEVTEAVKAERKRIENEVGGFIAGAYAMKFEHNSREAKFWDVWKDGYEQCRKDALNAIKYESRGQD